jgi:hypothetical protein
MGKSKKKKTNYSPFKKKMNKDVFSLEEKNIIKKRIVQIIITKKQLELCKSLFSWDLRTDWQNKVKELDAIEVRMSEYQIF